jgi:signal transduction histidine kinase
MFRSLRLRIAASHALVMMVILVGLGFSLQFLLARSLDRSASDELAGVVRGQVTMIREERAPVAPADSDIPSAAGIQVAVWGADGVLHGEPSEVPSWLRRFPQPVTNLTVDGEPVRIVTLPARVGGRTVAWVSAGRSLAAEAQLLHRVRLLLLAGSAIAVVASLGAGWWLAGRAVQPVQRAYEAQAGFAADASHELRTPLTFIRSGVEVLAQHDRELGGQVLDEVDYLTALSRHLLTLARAERGDVRLEVEPVDISEACRSSVRRSRTAHGNRLSAEGDALGAMADRVAFEAVLDAVLENVARHGGGEANVCWAHRGSDVVISVVDHGPGLPHDLHGKAFERFFREDPSRARETGGAGLGLAVARTLMEAQGGRMWLEPTPGNGLTVRAALPAL